MKNNANQNLICNEKEKITSPLYPKKISAFFKLFNHTMAK